MLVVLLYGDRFSECDTAAASLYTKLKERGVKAELVLQDLSYSARYPLSIIDYEYFLEQNIDSAINDDVEVYIANVPLIYSDYENKKNKNVVIKEYPQLFVKYRDNLINKLRNESHDILEYNLVMDKTNSIAAQKIDKNLFNIHQKDKEQYYLETYGIDEDAKSKREIYRGFGLDQLPSNSLTWQKIYEEVVCMLQGWDCYGI